MNARPEFRELDYVHEHRVRYRECDPMGVVYHTHYLDYFEAARTEALRHMGLSYRELEESGVIMPVVDARLRYHRPARYDDLLRIHTRFSLTETTARVIFDYVVRRRQSDTPLVTGTVTLCFVDAERGRPMRAPDQILAITEAAPTRESTTSQNPPRSS